MLDDDNLKEDLIVIEMKSCQRLQLLFDKLKLENILVCCNDSLFKSCYECMTVILSFSTTYFCESGFSEMMYIKNKHRNRLQLEDDLEIALSKPEPSLEKILKMKQKQKSG